MSIPHAAGSQTRKQSTLDFFVSRLPKKPYCSNDLEHGLIIRNVRHALTHSHIQPNDPRSKTWLLYDIDRPTSPDEITDDCGLPAPTLFIQNPQNGHAHALYGLEVALHYNTEKARLAPMRLAAAVERGMTWKLAADASYAGLICKNPLNEKWRTYATGGVYDLGDLSDWVDLHAANDAQTFLDPQGLGRNCDTFEAVRKWAYKAIRMQEWPSPRVWSEVVAEKAWAYNLASFAVPLDRSEVNAIARSIAKWTHKHTTSAGFSRWQAAQGRRGGKASGKVRAAANEDKRASAVLMASSGRKPPEIASELGVSIPTVYRWIKNSHEPISDVSPEGGPLLL